MRGAVVAEWAGKLRVYPAFTHMQLGWALAASLCPHGDLINKKEQVPEINILDINKRISIGL